MSLPGDLVDLGGLRVYVHRQGKGPPLVLVHGFLVSHWCFRGIIPRLAERFDVIALDLPGFGESDRPLDFAYDFRAYADTLVRLLDALAVPRAALLGHSMGGGIALTAAVRHPERVTHLVVCDTACYPVDLPLEGRLALVPVVGDVLFKQIYRRRDLERYFRTEVFPTNPALVDDSYIDYYWERLNRPQARAAALMALRALGDVADLAERPRRVRCPALVVWGERDHIFPVVHGERLARELPEGRLAVVPGAGHAVPEECPEDFLRITLEFLGAGRRRGRAATERAAS